MLEYKEKAKNEVGFWQQAREIESWKLRDCDATDIDIY